MLDANDLRAMVGVLSTETNTRDGYLALLQRALSTPHGVALEFDDFIQTERARRRFYGLRDSLRRAGDTSFDDLSFVMQPYGGPWIVRRDRLPRRDGEDGLSTESRLLSRDELPDHFGYCNDSFSVSTPKVRARK